MLCTIPHNKYYGILSIFSVTIRTMECSVEFLKNSKGYFEPGEKLNAEVTLKLKRTESVNSKIYKYFEQISSVLTKKVYLQA